MLMLFIDRFTNVVLLVLIRFRFSPMSTAAKPSPPPAARPAPPPTTPAPVAQAPSAVASPMAQPQQPSMFQQMVNNFVSFTLGNKYN